MSAVPTLIVDSPNVEASTYFPRDYRFEKSATGLADVVERFQHEGMEGRGEALRRSLEDHISPEKFKISLLKAWGAVSEAAHDTDLAYIDSVIGAHQTINQLNKEIWVSTYQMKDIKDMEMENVRHGNAVAVVPTPLELA